MLVFLAAAAIPTYLFTRQMAELNRQRNSRIAVYWYRQGEHQLANNDPEAAITSLRHATTDDRNNGEYAFTLAKALAANGHDDEARLALLRLREAAPDNPQAVRDSLTSQVALNRYGTNEEVARLALYLASDEASYSTGAVHVIDGGFTAT